MLKRVFSVVMFILLVTSMLTKVLNIEPVKASGTIYIRADGSIDPPTASISTVDNITYTFTGDINDSIVIERDNIMVDGAGYTLQGTNAYKSIGTDVTERSNVTIKNTNIKNYWYGIYLYSSSSNIISGNNITANSQNGVYLSSSSYNTVSGNSITSNDGGVWFSSSSYNTVSGNSITNNGDGVVSARASNNIVLGNNITANNRDGIYLYSSSSNIISGNNITANGYGIYLDFLSNYNSIFHNNFINNTQQVYSSDCVNVWDDGYPSGGNYWSDYNGTDLYKGPYQNETSSDGIGDTPYVIHANNLDNYPLLPQPQYVPITGDLNLDKTVDKEDAMLAASAFGSYPGHPRWNDQADLNHDDIIDIFDMIILADNFGKHS